MAPLAGFPLPFPAPFGVAEVAKISRILLLLLLVALGFRGCSFPQGTTSIRKASTKLRQPGKQRQKPKEWFSRPESTHGGRSSPFALEEISIPLALPKRAKIEVSTSSQEKLPAGHACEGSRTWSCPSGLAIHTSAAKGGILPKTPAIFPCGQVPFKFGASSSFWAAFLLTSSLLPGRLCQRQSGVY